jgi:hypothetical protein
MNLNFLRLDWPRNWQEFQIHRTRNSASAASQRNTPLDEAATAAERARACPQTVHIAYLFGKSTADGPFRPAQSAVNDLITHRFHAAKTTGTEPA